MSRFSNSAHIYWILMRICVFCMYFIQLFIIIIIILVHIVLLKCRIALKRQKKEGKYIQWYDSCFFLLFKMSTVFFSFLAHVHKMYQHVISSVRLGNDNYRYFFVKIFSVVTMFLYEIRKKDGTHKKNKMKIMIPTLGYGINMNYTSRLIFCFHFTDLLRRRKKKNKTTTT